MTIPTDNLHDRDVRALAKQVVEDAQHTAKEALKYELAELAAAEAQIDRMVYQDKSLASWRIWATVSGVVTAILAVPEVQVALTAAVAAAVPVAWAPVATAALTAILAAISKRRDPRPTKE